MKRNPFALTGPERLYSPNYMRSEGLEGLLTTIKVGKNIENQRKTLQILHFVKRNQLGLKSPRLSLVIELLHRKDTEGHVHGSGAAHCDRLVYPTTLRILRVHGLHQELHLTKLEKSFKGFSSSI